MMRARRLRMLAASAAMAAGLAGAPAAGAAPVTTTRAAAPSAHLTSARAVAGGAALELSYDVTCPAADYLSYLSYDVTARSTQGRVTTARDALALRCTGTRQRLVALAAAPAGGPAFRSGSVSVSSRLANCGEETPDCYSVADTSTQPVEARLPLRVSSQSIAATLDLRSTRLLRLGTQLRLRYALSCPAGNIAYLQAQVTQVGARGVLSTRPPVAQVPCTGAVQRATLTATAPSGTRFAVRAAVVDADVTDCGEPIGCALGEDTSFVIPYF